MRPRALLLAAASTIVVASTIAELRADTQTLTPAPKVSLPRLGAPAALDASKRVMKLAAHLKGLGATQSAPQTLEMRLTPTDPRHAGGARIVRAGVGTFNGADADEPDGSYVLVRGTGMVAMSSVEMRIPTEPGKLYVLDCRVRAPAGSSTKFALSRGTVTSLAPVEDGHVLSAFSATSAQTDVTISAMPGPNDVAVIGYFYGCDFGKAG